MAPTVPSSYAATESPEQAIEHFKANAGLNTPGEVVKLGPGDYLVEIIYEAKTSGYQRFLANASVTCEGISNPSPELLGLLKKSCESFKPTM